MKTLSEWTRSADRLPMPQESPSGYFWGWDERMPDESPALVEAWERDGIAMGFCHESCGIVNSITHWSPAVPPVAPDTWDATIGREARLRARIEKIRTIHLPSRRSSA